MADLKKQLTKLIRDEYQNWFAQQQIKLHCQKGCAACCSVNVRMSSIEGELIYDYIKEHKLEDWFGKQVCLEQNPAEIKHTTNGLARLCLAGDEDVQPEKKGEGRCIFLVDESCKIYEARPFSCRCFMSTVPCEKDSIAVIDQVYLTAATVVMQLIEHVGQKEYWGTMQDVLLALSDIPAHKGVRDCFPVRPPDMEARARTLSGEPIPGFLLDEDEYKAVKPLLDAIFNSTVNGRRVEDILNGR